ncbi:MAG: metal-dependent hydrolase [Deltaproteobacteria bacterium]|nr:metal-dependent hydrolase [Deltaproteobacteria bacterium]TLN04261.1 MAG: metal-dependent hydrolase [bacterium]
MKIYAASHLLPVSGPAIEGGALVVENGKIVAVGKLSELTAAFSAPVIENPGCAIIPGLVNAHSHLELTHFPSWKVRKGIDYSPRTYVDWIIQVIKIRRSLSPEEQDHSVLEGIRISLQSGTTALGEILSDPALLSLYLRSPLVGRVYLEAVGQTPQRCADVMSAIGETLPLFSGTDLAPGISPHTPHTVSEDFFRELRDYTARQALPLMIHLAESREESTFFFDSSGPIAEKLYPFVDWNEHLPPPRRTSPTAYLDSLGVLRPGTTLVHCVHISPSDAELLKKRGAAVVLCPRSNEKLDVGTAPVHLLNAAGIPLALGTDSLASNDSLSLFDEARFFLKKFPDQFSSAEVLRMMTLTGAEVLGREAEIGSLEQGKRGDFLVISLPENSGRDLALEIISEGAIREVFIHGNSLQSAGAASMAEL